MMIKKFRAWDKLRKKYIYSDKFLTLSRFFNRCELAWIPAYCTEQFTGLKDKNGKEIYENDILKLVNGDIGKLEISTNGFVLIGKFKDHGEIFYNASLSYLRPNESEIIGNIFDNPEIVIEKEPV